MFYGLNNLLEVASNRPSIFDDAEIWLMKRPCSAVPANLVSYHDLSRGRCQKKFLLKYFIRTSLRRYACLGEPNLDGKSNSDYDAIRRSP